MLSDLHAAIAKVCPIESVRDLGEGQYEIDFSPDATPEQQAAAQQALTDFEDKPVLWAQFRAQVLMSGAYLRIVTSSPITQTLNATLVWLLGRLGENPELLPDFANVWSAIAMYASPTESEITALNKVGIACRMPFVLNEQGLIILQ